MDETAQNNSGSSQFSFLVLTLWTLLLAAYTWWMLRSPFLRPVPMPPPMPTELAVGPVVTHDTNTLEGLLTWTYARVLGRLARATRDNNLGRIRTYTQSREWLQRRFAELRSHGNGFKDVLQSFEMPVQLTVSACRLLSRVTTSWTRKIVLQAMAMGWWNVNCYLQPMDRFSNWW